MFYHESLHRDCSLHVHDYDDRVRDHGRGVHVHSMHESFLSANEWRSILYVWALSLIPIKFEVSVYQCFLQTSCLNFLWICLTSRETQSYKLLRCIPCFIFSHDGRDGRDCDHRDLFLN